MSRNGNTTDAWFGVLQTAHPRCYHLATLHTCLRRAAIGLTYLACGITS